MPFPNLAGRPSSYTDESIEKVGEFAALELEAGNLPTRAGLANHIGITKDTLIKWGNEHKHLLDALKAFDQLQENQVWQKALNGEYNSNIAKLMLHNHGYSDRTQTDNLNKNVDVPVDEDLKPEEQLQDVLKRIKELQGAKN